MATDRPDQGQASGAYGPARAAEGWRRGAAARAEFLGPVTERMLDLAGIGPGNRVLDVGAGTGEQTLMAAHRVGPAGSVLATDVAASMLALAAQAAQQAGLSNVETQVQDARTLDRDPESFDAAISRVALMLIPERERVLTGIRRALKPGGKLAAIVFSTPEQNPALAQTRAVARRYAGLPALRIDDPGLFALGDPGVLQAAYEQAGFRDVAVHAQPVVRRFASLAAAVQFGRDSSAGLAQLLAGLSDAARERAWAEIDEIHRQFEDGDGVAEPGEYLIGVGTA
jgi:ubiquinone/menaquinone biosynthesis C-methylase UbiE